MTPADVSIVIPVLNEQDSISGCVTSALKAGATEIIVCDGGSRDETTHLATEAGATQIVGSAAGRGKQLQAGADAATKDYLLFLHADNQLGPDCLNQICSHQPIWGAFRQHIDSNQWVYRWLETGNAWRVKVRRMPFGDQAVFVQRTAYLAKGGFADVPLMEDVLLAQAMRTVAWPVLLPGPVIVSSRRWNHHGVVRQTLRNFKIQIAHACGASPETLAKWYG